ncbi:hypothetical protein RDI58_024631 [Solanum bulbocastanum]|uniref:Uncharacterized protein n=1 Tax=Solanum bulbocastanum TaxID=147425 RepID=A0AAN8Y5U0_SOLBU
MPLYSLDADWKRVIVGLVLLPPCFLNQVCSSSSPNPEYGVHVIFFPVIAFFPFSQHVIPGLINRKELYPFPFCCYPLVDVNDCFMHCLAWLYFMLMSLLFLLSSYKDI